MARRALTALETPYVLTNTTSGGGFVLRGSLDRQRLAAAFAALRREFPVLTGRIEPTADGYDLVTDDARPPEQYAPIVATDEAFTPGYVDFGLNPLQSLATVRVMSNGELHRVSLGVNHAVADGAHAIGLNLRMWQLYTDPAAETAPTAQLPSSPLDLADRMTAPTAPPQHPAAQVRSVGVVPSTAAVDGGDFGYDRIVLDDTETTAVRARAKAAGLTLHGLVAGIIVVAERAELDVPPDEAAPMAVFSPIDLRVRSAPPVGLTEATNFAGSSTVPVEVCGDTEPEAVGRAVVDRIRADLEDGTAAATLTGAGGVTVVGGAPVRLSNLGVMVSPALPPELTAVDFYTSSDVDITRVRELIRALPAEALQALQGLHFHAMTFDGRLSIEMRWAPGTVTPEVIERIRDRVDAGLRARMEVLT